MIELTMEEQKILANYMFMFWITSIYWNSES
jgi:hypothetical protein